MTRLNWVGQQCRGRVGKPKSGCLKAIMSYCTCSGEIVVEVSTGSALSSGRARSLM